jgi:hypothetical protein
MFKDGVPELPGGDGRLSFFKRCVWWAIWGGRFPFGNTDTVKIENIGGKYYFTANRVPSAPSGILWPPKIYDVTAGYAQGQAVWVQAADTLTTTGATYPGTGLTALSKAGLWIAIKAAPAGYFPVAPYPSPDDPTASTMYWLYFGNLYC